MKRRLYKLGRRLTLFLLLGAVVNIAVAWGSALWLSSRNHPHRVVEDSMSNSNANQFWRKYAPNEWQDADLSDFYSSEYYGPFGSSVGITTVIYPEPRRIVAVQHVQAGWPIHSLEYCAFADSQPYAAWHIRLRTGWNLDGPQEFAGMMQRILPLKPIRFSFVINTLFYTGAFWPLFAAPFAMRRYRRIKRGLCPACAYPVGSSAVCTECGKPVRPKRVELKA